MRALRSRPFLLIWALVLATLPVVAIFVANPPAASAHPLGNFTVNRYSRIELYSDAVRVHYVLDMAEIPTFQEMDRIDTDGDGQTDLDESRAYLATKAEEIRGSLSLSLNGSPQDLAVMASDIAFPEGQAGLRTLRVTLVLQSPVPAGPVSLEYRDENYSDRVGWKEIIVRPAVGVDLVDSSTSSEDVSHELTSYPQDLLSSPLDVREASARFDASRGMVVPVVSGSTIGPAPEKAAKRVGAGFAALIDNRDITVPVLLIALAAAFGFGALHALEPGHGKTFVAAYFVGVKGTAREAVLLGLIVASTHTVGVFAIGLLTLFGSQFILPEDLYPWLSLASAVMVLALGVRLLASRTRGFRWLRERVQVARHGHVHDERSAHGHGHDHAGPEPGGSPWKGLIALGLADGLTPSPSALIVLLAAVSLDRIPLGVGLIVAFSVGLAAVLAAVSLGLVYARRMAERFGLTGARFSPQRLTTRLGRVSTVDLAQVSGAVLLIAVGLMLTLRALSQPGLV